MFYQNEESSAGDDHEGGNEVRVSNLEDIKDIMETSREETEEEGNQ